MSLRDQARTLLNGRPLIVSLVRSKTSDLDLPGLRQFLTWAVELGATHVDVGTLPWRRSWFLPDNQDPYASWCNQSLGLFRVCPPPALAPWIPVADAAELRAGLRARLDLCAEFGLKGVVNGIEPLWLPEGVYRAHPRWRGAQCELGRIARRPYFTPNLDEPEVIALYRAAMLDFARQFPEIDQFTFMTNDSGGGIAWSPNLYPGMNGPPATRMRDPGLRIANWLKALQDGAREAGTNIRINLFSSGLPADLLGSTRAKLPPGLFLNWGNEHGEAWGGPGAGLGSDIWGANYPAQGLGDPAGFIRGLQSIYHNPKGDTHRASLSVHDSALPLARTLASACLATPEPGRVAHASAVLSAAGTWAGTPAQAETVANAWDSVAQALTVIGQVRQPGFGLVLPFCGVSMRWLTRPLVPQPAALTADEQAHYAPHLFSTATPEQNQNLCLVLGKPVFRGHSAMWLARWCLTDAIGRLRGAAGSFSAAAQASSEPAAKDRLMLDAARVRALACLCANARNTIMYQYYLDVAEQPQFGPNPMDYDDNIVYDQRALQLRKVAREELDNINELRELLAAHPGLGQVLAQAPTPADESVFLLGPNLAADLARKCEIMLDHWQDYETLFPATKVWELDPRPVGNFAAPTPPASQG